MPPQNDASDQNVPAGNGTHSVAGGQTRRVETRTGAEMRWISSYPWIGGSCQPHSVRTGKSSKIVIERVILFEDNDHVFDWIVGLHDTRPKGFETSRFTDWLEF